MMARKVYEGCMNYLVYRIFSDSVGASPLYSLVAQFDDPDDIQPYIDYKNKYMARRYGVLENKEGAEIQERLPFLCV